MVFGSVDSTIGIGESGMMTTDGGGLDERKTT